MRRGDLAVFAGQLRTPVEGFVRETRVRLVLLINASGQVLAQHGFARAFDVIGVSSLGAAIYASSSALAEVMGQRRFEHLHHAGESSQIFIAPFATPSEEVILVTVFGEDSSVGLVRVFFRKLADEVAALPGWSSAPPTADAEAFERDLDAGLDQIFGPS